jgi:hypothetical protein
VDFPPIERFGKGREELGEQQGGYIVQAEGGESDLGRMHIFAGYLHLSIFASSGKMTLDPKLIFQD